MCREICLNVIVCMYFRVYGCGRGMCMGVYVYVYVCIYFLGRILKKIEIDFRLVEVLKVESIYDFFGFWEFFIKVDIISLKIY